MKFQSMFTRYLVVCSLCYISLISYVTGGPEFVTVLTEPFLLARPVIHTAEYDVVNIALPPNALNFNVKSTTIFFVQADNYNGKRVDKGLYVRRNGVVTKLLENGRDIAASNDNTKTAYFAADDGLYSYNFNENKAEKYGTITDSIIGLAKVNGSNIFYILTDDHVVFKVTEEGTKKERLENVIDAQQIVLDYDNNLYYYTSDKRLYVLRPDGIRKFMDLPKIFSYINILTPSFEMHNGVLLLLDQKTYVAENTPRITNFGEFHIKATAYNIENIMLQYYAYEKKIYEFNVVYEYMKLQEDKVDVAL